MSEFDFQSLNEACRSRLKPKRYRHVLGVTHTAVVLAEIHGVDLRLAALAGLLHDYSKEMKPKAIEADLAERGVEIPEDDRDLPAVWHGLHAVTIARQDWSVGGSPELEDLLRAVEFHSTAEEDFSPLSRVLFMADATEPSRQYEGVDELRELCRKNLDAAFRRLLTRKVEYVSNQGGLVSPRATRALNQLKTGDKVA